MNPPIVWALVILIAPTQSAPRSQHFLGPSARDLKTEYMSDRYASRLQVLARRNVLNEDESYFFHAIDSWPWNNKRFLLYQHLSHLERWLQYAFLRHNGLPHADCVALVLISGGYDKNAWLSLNYLQGNTYRRYGVKYWDMNARRYIQHDGATTTWREHWSEIQNQSSTANLDELETAILKIQDLLRNVSTRYIDDDADYAISTWDEYDDPSGDHLLQYID